MWLNNIVVHQKDCRIDEDFWLILLTSFYMSAIYSKFQLNYIQYIVYLLCTYNIFLYIT